MCDLANVRGRQLRHQVLLLEHSGMDAWPQRLAWTYRLTESRLPYRLASVETQTRNALRELQNSCMAMRIAVLDESAQLAEVLQQVRLRFFVARVPHAFQVDAFEVGHLKLVE